MDNMYLSSLCLKAKAMAQTLIEISSDFRIKGSNFKDISHMRGCTEILYLTGSIVCQLFCRDSSGELVFKLRQIRSGLLTLSSR